LIGLVLIALVGIVHGQKWTLSDSGFATIACAVSFTSNTHGVAPVADNGEGSLILETKDAGATWNPVPAPNELVFLGGAAQGVSSVAATMFDAVYSDEADGTYNFTSSILVGGLTSQNVETGKLFGKTFYGAAGNTFFGGNGVAVSGDSGAIFSFVNISTLQTFSRYGAYPSQKTWYISAGEWPENNKRTTSNVYQLTNRFHLHRTKRNSRTHYSVKPNKRTEIVDNGYKAQIVKTTDGGKTWTSLFYDEGNFYFNEIDCADETHCCAVGEADTSAIPGIRFYCTTDGKTFQQVYFNGDADFSVMAIQAISAQEYWAAGGDMGTSFTGYFWHTTDGGTTWTSQTIPGVYGNAMSFPSANVGFATGFDVFETSVFMKYA